MQSASPFAAVWTVLDDQVDAGRFPGYAAAIRRAGHTEIRAGGTRALGGTDLMRSDTVFRIASLSKLLGGALALALVGDGAFGLDDPVARWLPELAHPEVLARPGAELDDCVPLTRPIVVRDLLSFTFGLGLVLDDSPIKRELARLGISPDGDGSPQSNDAFMADVASVPLVCQPGERWLYHTGADVLGVLIARAAGRSLGQVLADRVTGPLGMESTGFYATDASRLAASYAPDPAGDGLTEDVDDSILHPPRFESLGAGLVSTVEDLLAFLGALTGGSPVIDDDVIALMTTDSLSDEQRTGVHQIMGPGVSWGLGVGVDIERVEAKPWMTPGRFGWNGGSGTTAAVDPANDLSAVLLTQRIMMSPTGDFDDFWRALAHSR